MHDLRAPLGPGCHFRRKAVEIVVARYERGRLNRCHTEENPPLRTCRLRQRRSFQNSSGTGAFIQDLY